MMHVPYINTDLAHSSSRRHPGLGHPSRYQVSRQKQEANAKLLADQRLSMSDMEKAERIKKGCAPYDPQDTSVSKLINWDYETHYAKDKFEDMYTFWEKYQCTKQWLDHMKTHNYWCSFFVWFHDEAHEQLPTTLQPTKFSDKVKQMYYGKAQESISPQPLDPAAEEFVDPDEEMPNLENLHISNSPKVMEYELVDYDDYLLDQNIITENPQDLCQAIVPYQPVLHAIVTDIENSQQEHKWTTTADKDGNTREVTTVGEIPPWESVVEQPGENKIYHLYAYQQDSSTLNSRNLMAGINWTNAFLHKWHKIDTKKINAIGKILEDNVLKTVANIDTNLPIFQKNIIDTAQ